MELNDKKLEKIPAHVALIVDGNRRWAEGRGLPYVEGHKKAIDRIEELIEYAGRIGIKNITFWLFSTENWKRPQDFIENIFGLARKVISGDYLGRLAKKGGRINILGDMSRFPEDIQKGMIDGVNKTKSNDKIVVNFAINYGGRAEILRAVKRFIEEKVVSKWQMANGKWQNSNVSDDKSGNCCCGDWEKELTEEVFSNYLYTAGQPDPDLIIRTGGELRLSGYLPWQGVYSEFYFTKTYFPDFDKLKFEEALWDYQGRDRRFGGWKK